MWRAKKSEAHELVRAAFHIFRGRAVVKDDERVAALEKKPRDHQPLFHLVLLADYDEHSRILIAEPQEGLVVGERRADQDDVVELAAERAVELVHHESRLPRVRRANHQDVERDLPWIHLVVRQISSTG